MSVDFMRAMDKWLGVPGCLLISLLEFFLRPFLPVRSRPVKKILFLQISEMGSSISAYSSIVKARELFPNVEIYYFIFREMQDSVHLLGAVKPQNVFTVSSKSFLSFSAGLLRMIWSMRRQNFDAILDLELFSRLSSILCFLFGAPSRAGFNRFHMEGLYRGSTQTHKVVYNHTQHISQNFLSLVYALQEDPAGSPLAKRTISPEDIRELKIRSSKAEKKSIRDRIRAECPAISAKTKIILFNPNASDLLPLRRWPLENYIQTAIRLLQHPDFSVVITGVQSEFDRAAQICQAVQNRRCLNFAGKTTLRELIDLYNASDLLLSNDSGPPNFASLTDIHTLVFFGPETPLCYKPTGKNIEALYANYHCSPCVSAYNHRKSACTDNKCLQAITVDEVYRQILSRMLPVPHP